MQTSYSGSYKAVFNESSSSTMLVIYNIPCYVKLGDEDWTVIDDMQSQMDFEDVIYEEGKFYAVDSLGRAVAVDSNLVIQEIAFSIYDRRGCGQVHQMRLVMSLGDLFLVDRYPAEYDRVQFKVFKLNWSFRVGKKFGRSGIVYW
ncbi:F-box domain containing protein [Quillaja saponaria]|uniref:F-box domain containing protein n=1 Tax=Quillaja saponaria TaxID=32244 RepID=A0AAD7P6P2_QUISA|nr:F-box domain containing protein [Quillaja saponaria]